jgi:hypothetical protein
MDEKSFPTVWLHIVKKEKYLFANLLRYLEENNDEFPIFECTEKGSYPPLFQMLRYLNFRNTLSHKASNH